MVQITIDTKTDSITSLRHVIQLLEEELKQRGQSHQPYEPMQITEPATSVFGSTNPDYGSQTSNHSSQIPESNTPATSSNPFDMFGSTSTPEPSPPSQPVFDNPLAGTFDQPKEEPRDILNEPLGSSTYSSSMSANDLLNQDDDEDEERPTPSSSVQIEPY